MRASASSSISPRSRSGQRLRPASRSSRTSAGSSGRDGSKFITSVTQPRSCRVCRALFDQHRRRWPGPENPSRFHDPEVCRLFEVATERWVGADILRFTQVDWDGRPIACHYGLELAGRRFMKAFSFEPELRGRSPGGILMRHIIIGAREEGARVFDFGTGDQDFKARYATRSWRVLGWRFYPPDHE